MASPRTAQPDVTPAPAPVRGAIMGYYGSKHRTAEWLIGLMPTHRGYCEPYAGSLSVLARKPPARIEVANDLDDNLITFWRLLRDRLEDLERVSALTPHSRAEHATTLPLRPDPYDELEHARRVWVRLSQGRAGQLRRTGWRHHQTIVNTGSGMAARLDQYLGRFAAVSARIRSVSLECRPALDVIADYGRDPDMLLYVDPPYLGTTRPGSTDGYILDMRGVDEHEQLAEALHACRASVVLSGYPSGLYDRLYAGWTRHEASTWTGQGNRFAARTEVAWCNREADLFGGGL